MTGCSNCASLQALLQVLLPLSVESYHALNDLGDRQPGAFYRRGRHGLVQRLGAALREAGRPPVPTTPPPTPPAPRPALRLVAPGGEPALPGEAGVSDMGRF